MKITVELKELYEQDASDDITACKEISGFENCNCFDCWNSKQFCLIPLLNLTQGPRSDETKRQICFLVHIFHYSEDTTLVVHWLTVGKRLCFTDPLSQEPTAVNCCIIVFG